MLTSHVASPPDPFTSQIPLSCFIHNATTNGPRQLSVFLTTRVRSIKTLLGLSRLCTNIRASWPELQIRTLLNDNGDTSLSTEYAPYSHGANIKRGLCKLVVNKWHNQVVEGGQQNSIEADRTDHRIAGAHCHEVRDWCRAGSEIPFVPREVHLFLVLLMNDDGEETCLADLVAG